MPNNGTPRNATPRNATPKSGAAKGKSPENETSAAFAELLELAGRRWTLRIVWELRGGALAFNDLRTRAGGLSQSVLVTRLTELFGAGLIADVEGGYELTAHGRALARELKHLDTWSTGWVGDR